MPCLGVRESAWVRRASRRHDRLLQPAGSLAQYKISMYRKWYKQRTAGRLFCTRPVSLWPCRSKQAAAAILLQGVTARRCRGTVPRTVADPEPSNASTIKPRRREVLWYCNCTVLRIESGRELFDSTAS